MESLLASRHKRELGHCSSFCEGALRPGRPQRMATPIDGTAFHGAMLPRWRGRGDVRTPASPSRPGLLHVGETSPGGVVPAGSVERREFARARARPHGRSARGGRPGARVPGEALPGR
jgi:hypothetical protein